MTNQEMAKMVGEMSRWERFCFKLFAYAMIELTYFVYLIERAIKRVRHGA